MAVKTITLDLEAYNTLARHKKPGQSFSQVIKEHFGRARTGRDLLRLLEQVPVSSELLDAWEEQVELRSESEAKAPQL